MRKITAIILILAMLFSLTACKKCEHSYTSSISKEATCIEEGVKTFTCSKCGDSYTETIPITDEHNYTSEITKEASVSETGIITYTCSLCGHSYTEPIDKVKSNWKIGYYVDSFGDYTDDSYAIGTFTGTFSNSVTNGNVLTVYVYLDPKFPDSITIRLLEYGDFKATFNSKDKILISTKDSSGSIQSYYGNTEVFDGDLYVRESSLRQAIEENEELKFDITVGNNEYRFTTDNIGLSDVLK